MRCSCMITAFAPAASLRSREKSVRDIPRKIRIYHWIFIAVIMILVLLKPLWLGLMDVHHFSGKIDPIIQSWSQGLYSQALSEARMALQSARNNSERAVLHYWAGLSYYKMADYKNAITEENQAVSLDPAYYAPYAPWHLKVLSQEGASLLEGDQVSLQEIII